MRWSSFQKRSIKNIKCQWSLLPHLTSALVCHADLMNWKPVCMPIFFVWVINYVCIWDCAVNPFLLTNSNKIMSLTLEQGTIVTGFVVDMLGGNIWGFCTRALAIRFVPSLNVELCIPCSDTSLNRGWWSMHWTHLMLCLVNSWKQRWRMSWPHQQSPYLQTRLSLVRFQLWGLQWSASFI